MKEGRREVRKEGERKGGSEGRREGGREGREKLRDSGLSIKASRSRVRKTYLR